MASLERMINVASDDLAPVIEARTANTRKINNIEEAENLRQLFDLLERLKTDRLSIRDFIDIAQPSKEEILGSCDTKSLRQDFCDSTNDLDPLATKILARLKSIVLDVHSQETEFEFPDFVQYDTLLKVEQQLLDSSVYICVVGRYNVGKTTLINALIGEDVLPVSIAPETAVTLYIQHDDKVEQSLESGNTPQPRLINWSNSSQIVTGIRNIKQHLSELHHGIRDKIIMPQKEDYLLKIEFPILQTQGNPKPYLVDTPGSNEVGEGDLQKISELNLKSAAAYIFVMKYDDIKNKEDYEAFKTIYERDPQIFQSERLTIVVTHYDTYFQNCQAQLSVGDVKRTIADTLTKVLQIEVSENIIFPVCGKWANDARLCKSCSINGNYNDIQMGLMNVEMKKSKMTFGEASVKVGSMPREDVLRNMERISLIAELEERIDMVSKRLAVIWRQNIISSCRGFLKAGKDLMEYLESKYAKKIEETEYQTLYAQKVVEHYKAMLDSISSESKFLADLKTSYENDTKYEGKFKNKVDDLLEDLRSILLEKQRQRKYGIQQLKEDINEKFYANAETNMKRWLLQTKFIRCQRLLHHYTQRVSEKFGRLRSAAASAVEQGGFAPTLAGHSNFFGDDNLEDIDEKMEGTLTTLKKCELNDIIRQTHWIRMKLPLLRANVIKDDNLEQLVQERQQAIETQHREFFEGVKEEVILYFFKTYCNVVVKELTLFITLIEEHGQIIQLRQLNERKKELSEKKQKKERYSLLKDHFAQLSTRLQFVEPQYK